MSRAVVFDLDDTLYPERSYVDSGFVAVAEWAERSLGVPAERCLSELRALFAAGVRQGTFDRWLEGHGIDPDRHVPTMVEVYRGHRPRISPFECVPHVLRRLRRRHRIGILSDGYAKVQRMKLESLALSPLVDEVLLTDELGRESWKPDPAAFGILLAHLEVRARDAVYVADNPVKDFLGARRAGMASVRVRTPLGLYSHLAPATPEHASDHEIGRLEELEAALTRVWPGGEGLPGSRTGPGGYRSNRAT